MKHTQTKTVPMQTPAPHLAAHKIRTYRRLHRMSQNDLGRELGVSGPAVAGWEGGKKIASHDMQGALQARGICDPNDWHLPAPPPARVSPAAPVAKAG